MKSLTDKIFHLPLLESIKQQGGNNLFFTGLNGSLPSFVISKIFESNYQQIVFLSNDSTRLFKLKDDINIINQNEPALIYLDKYDEEYENELSPLSSVMKKLSGDGNYILLTSPDVLDKNIISEKSFNQNIISLIKGSDFNYEYLITKLNEFGLIRKQIVEEENDYAVRGGLIDIFPENLSQPVRIEFFGNTIESIREFDLVTQRSISRLENVDILPPTIMIESLQEKEPLLDYVKKSNLIILDEPDLIKNEHDDIFNKLNDYNRSYFSIFPLSKSDSISDTSVIKEITFSSKSQPAFNSNFKQFYSNLKDLSEKGYATVLYDSNLNKREVIRASTMDEINCIKIRDSPNENIPKGLASFRDIYDYITIQYPTIISDKSL